MEAAAVLKLVLTWGGLGASLFGLWLAARNAPENSANCNGGDASTDMEAEIAMAQAKNRLMRIGFGLSVVGALMQAAGPAFL